MNISFIRATFIFIVISIISLCKFNPVFSGEPDKMVLIPAGKFTMKVEYRIREGLSADPVIIDDVGTRYGFTKDIHLSSYYIDETEVTNKEYKKFLNASGYKPKWPKNFLKHWTNRTYPKGKDKHPVVWVSMEDAKAYAEWAGKRLPTEAEWQKAAQGNDSKIWPWGNIYDPDKANVDSEDTKPVGSYPDGAGPYGCFDMTGNAWEWTDSLQSDGYHFFSWLRGGSYFLAKGSHWYMEGGAIANYQRVKFWHINPGLNRCATIGFRCVKDPK